MKFGYIFAIFEVQLLSCNIFISKTLVTILKFIRQIITKIQNISENNFLLSLKNMWTTCPQYVQAYPLSAQIYYTSRMLSTFYTQKYLLFLHVFHSGHTFLFFAKIPVLINKHLTSVHRFITVYRRATQNECACMPQIILYSYKNILI